MILETNSSHFQMAVSQINERRREAERDAWLNQERPMTVSKKTWKEKCIEKDEKGSSLDSDVDIDSAMSYENMGISMVFHLLGELALPKSKVV
jgi:hypothetical protein